jgi:hypothetical protein
MIISASFRTDIPTFYGTWFMRRVRAGYAKMINPYSAQVYQADLTPQAVDGFVFWTKNIGPFLRYLPELRQRGYPFVVQHTINGYPRELESRVMDYWRTTEYVKRLAGDYGPSCAVWRYDPILLSSLTPADWHRRRFAILARRLEGATDEVVISFAQLYQKTRRNTEEAAREQGFTWDAHEQATLDDRLAVLRELAAMAKAHGMRLTVCSQHDYLMPGGERGGALHRRPPNGAGHLRAAGASGEPAGAHQAQGQPRGVWLLRLEGPRRVRYLPPRLRLLLCGGRPRAGAAPLPRAQPRVRFPLPAQGPRLRPRRRATRAAGDPRITACAAATNGPAAPTVAPAVLSKLVPALVDISSTIREKDRSPDADAAAPEKDAPACPR